MSFKIGFLTDKVQSKTGPEVTSNSFYTETPRKSIVQVYFPTRHMNLAYYNDQFDLHIGDYVYVDGKLEGLIGRVTEVNYNFKIKLSDYKRVIAVVDTNVKGQFYMAGSHFVTFDLNTLPKEKATLWFKAPENEEDEIVSGNDDSVFNLDDLKGMNVSMEIAERGHQYYMDNKVKYLCIDGNKGYAVVTGREAYTIEFTYNNGDVSNLTCSCFCSSNCKHTFATMLQLKDSLGIIEKHYSELYKETGYFAVIDKLTLFNTAIEGKDSGSFIL